MLVNSLFRVSYGVGALFVPSKMSELKLAADTAEHPEARLFVRGFGAHQIAVAAVGLASLRWRRLEQPAAVAAIAIDAFDMRRGCAAPRCTSTRRSASASQRVRGGAS